MSTSDTLATGGFDKGCGTLFVVSTPIGNLEDITYRAVRVLRETDIVAAEDTRTTNFLLKHFDIRKPMVSYFSHNETQKADRLVRAMLQGQNVALVTDAGTPGISDPAYVVIRQAVAAGIAVVPVPGPSAPLAALVASGLPMDRFVFEGFLPLKKGRQTRWTELRNEERTIVLFESPLRIVKAIEELIAHLGDRQIAVVREVTKKFEEVLRGNAIDVLARLKARAPRGEYVIVVAGTGYKSDHPEGRHHSLLSEPT
jgi:16S rRNA (cytidine1402-2'-O)-methyltransferase